jgi:hypothetical protein
MYAKKEIKKEEFNLYKNTGIPELSTIAYSRTSCYFIKLLYVKKYIGDGFLKTHTVFSYFFNFFNFFNFLILLFFFCLCFHSHPSIFIITIYVIFIFKLSFPFFSKTLRSLNLAN